MPWGDLLLTATAGTSLRIPDSIAGLHDRVRWGSPPGDWTVLRATRHFLTVQVPRHAHGTHRLVVRQPQTGHVLLTVPVTVHP